LDSVDHSGPPTTPPYNHEVLALAARDGKWAVGIDAVDTAAFDALVRALAATTT
jgi:hypothetical protein